MDAQLHAVGCSDIETQTDSPAPSQQLCDSAGLQQQLSDIHVQAEKSAAKQQQVIAALQARLSEAEKSAAEYQQVVATLQARLSEAEKSAAEYQQVNVALEAQLCAQTVASQEAEVAAQRAQQALLEAQTQASSQLQLEGRRTAAAAEELQTAQKALQDQSLIAQQQQAELQQLANMQSELTQQAADLSRQLTTSTQRCSQLTHELEEAKQRHSEVAAQLECSHADNTSLQDSISTLEQQLVSSISSRDLLEESVEKLSTRLAVVKVERAAASGELATVRQQYAESKSLCDQISVEMNQLTQDSASSAQLLSAELDEQAARCKKLQQQLQEAEEEADLHRAAAEQLQCVLNAAQEGRAQLKQKINRQAQQLTSQAEAHSTEVAVLQRQAQEFTQQQQTQQQAHSAELSRLAAEHARAESRAEQLLTELQAAQQACQALLKQAAETEAEAGTLKAQTQELRTSLLDRDDLILELDNQIKVSSACIHITRTCIDTWGSHSHGIITCPQTQQP